MSYFGLLRVMAINLFIAFNFDVALSYVAGGQPCKRRVVIDRHADATKSIPFSLIALYMYVRS